MIALSPMDTPSSSLAPAPIHRALADIDAVGLAPLLEDRLRRVGEVVVATDDVGVHHQQRASTAAHAARREQLAVEADVGAVAQLDVAVLARQDGVATDEHAAADTDALVRLALGVEQAVVVDHDVVGDVDTCADP